MAQSLLTRLSQTIKRCPEKPVFSIQTGSSTWQTVTYQQFSERIERFTRGLVAYGLGPGTRAAMMVPPSVDMFALVMALLKTGVAPVMVDPAIGLRNVTPCLAECRPEVYFGSALTHGIRCVFGWGQGSLRLNLTLADLARAGKLASSIPSAEFDPESEAAHETEAATGTEAAPDAEAAIVYTSGSTGLPKGAIYTRANFVAQIEMLVKALRLNGDEIDLPAFPLFAIIDCLLGVTAVIPDMRFPPPAKVDPARMTTAIHSQRVDTLFVSPAALARLAEYGTRNDLRLDSLKKVITAGAPAPAEVQEQFVKMLSLGAELFGVYGSTETLPVSMVNSCEILEETRYRSAQGAGVCIGRPVAGARVQIIPIRDGTIPDDPIPDWTRTQAEARTLPAGRVGEIAVIGPAVTHAYVAREQANRLSKITAGDGSIIHRMGDLGYFDDQGRLWFCGRKSQRVETAGGTLFTEQVEGIFNTHPLVYRTALVGVNKHGATEPVLWVELTPQGRRAGRDKIQRELLEMARSHALTQSIQTILFHPSFPTDIRHNSKIIREKLAQLAAERV